LTFGKENIYTKIIFAIKVGLNITYFENILVASQKYSKNIKHKTKMSEIRMPKTPISKTPKCPKPVFDFIDLDSLIFGRFGFPTLLPSAPKLISLYQASLLLD
jgi:hypothetical protein